MSTATARKRTSRTLHDVFCENIRLRLAAMEINQSDLSRRMNCSRNYVSNLISGRRCPTLHVVERVSKALDTKPSKLLSY